MRDPYDVLGVDRLSGQEDIKRAYRKLVRECHPDMNPSPGAERRFKEVTAAFGIVSDPRQRALYDEHGPAGLEPGFDPRYAANARARSAPPPTHSPFGDMSAFAEVMGSLFDDVPDDPPPSPRANTRAEPVRVRGAVDAMVTYTGGTTTVHVVMPSGRTEALRVRIQAGAKAGDVIPLPSGIPGVRGDLSLELEVTEHPLVRRSGDDLEMDVPITLLEALQGGPVTVPTPVGMARVQLPPVCAGQKLRLRGKGVQRADRPGNLVLTLRIALPEVVDATVVEACRAIERAYVGDVRDRIRF